MELTVPSNYSPRWYQELILKAAAKGYKRIIIILPRRAGKDLTTLCSIFVQMTQRVGSYFYFFPEAKQARRTIWDGMHDGFKFMDHMPREYVKKRREDTMSIELFPSKGQQNGSIFTLLPGNDPNRIVGSNPIGCVFSEWPLMNPAIWDYVKPMLAQNNGLAIFPYTPRGHNHGFTLYEEALQHPDEWFVLRLTSNETLHLSPNKEEHFRILERERQSYIATYGNDALYQQEYMCSFDAPLVGAYYGDMMSDLDRKGMITDVPHDPTLPVYTTWDIGINDECVIWFVQITNGGVWRWIDHIYGAGQNAAYYVQQLKDKQMLGYRYGGHYLPHDAGNREPGTGLTYAQQIQQFFPPETVHVVERIKFKYNRITAVRNILPMSMFDKTRCENGINGMKSYRREWSEELMTYVNVPKHDWASHHADSLGQVVQFFRPAEERRAVVHDTAEDLDAYG